MKTTDRPQVTPLPHWSFPTAETLTLPNGERVLFYHRPGQHVVAASLVIDLPLSLEPPGKEGLAGLVARTLSDGTRSLPGTEFEDAVEDCGARFDTSVGYPATTVFLDVPASRFAAGMDLLAQAVSEPTLADADLGRNRALRLTDIQHQLSNPAQLANIALRRALIDHSCRSSLMVGGHPATVNALDGAAARDFHKRLYQPSSSTLVIAGDLPDNAVSAVEEAFGRWTDAGSGTREHERPVPNQPTAQIMDRPESVQADIRLANFTIDRADPRWSDLQVAVRILGGAFGSRLNRVLREEKGYTYGVGMGNSPMRHGGFTTVWTSTRTDAVADTLALLPDLLDVSSNPFTQEEVDKARTFLLGAAPMHYATAGGVSHAVANLTSVGLTADFIDSTHAALGAVTPESVGTAASGLLLTEGATLVMVGDAASLAAAADSAGWDARVVPIEEISDPEPRPRR